METSLSWHRRERRHASQGDSSDIPGVAQAALARPFILIKWSGRVESFPEEPRMPHSVSHAKAYRACVMRLSSCIFASTLCYSGLVGADVIYSGLQNIVLEGVPGTQQTLSVNVAGGSTSWDRMQLSVSGTGQGGGTNDIGAGAEVALASSAAIFPRITRFDYGEPFPVDPIFGSGSEILWGFGYGPADGSFYAAMMLGTFGTGPEYVGWIQLLVENSSTLSARITVIDWAYSNQVGEAIAMGQVAVSEPSSLVLFGAGLLGMAASGRLRRGHCKL